MRHETRTGTAAIAFAAVAMLLLMAASSSEASAGYDADLGDMHSMTVQFVFTGSDAASVEWDFGDGTPVSTEWNPVHTYAETGEYIVTQTAYNSYNNGSTATKTYRISVLGYPVVSFDSHGGTAVDDFRLSSRDGVADRPEDPVRAGYAFTGWYTDAGCTALYDWASNVTGSFVLHAGWDAVGTPVCIVSFDCDGGSVPMDPVSVEADSEFEVPGYNGSKAGCEFAGWKLDGELLEPGSAIRIGSDALLTASWSETTPADDGRGGTGSFIEENPMTVAAAVIALVAAALIAVRITRS